MGWNGSDKEEAKLQGKQESRSRRSAVGVRGRAWRGLVAGTVVVIGGGIAAWLMVGGEQEREAVADGKAKAAQQIAEAAPQVGARQGKAAEAGKKPVEKPTPYWKASTTNGLSKTQILKWEAYHRAPPCYTNTTSLTAEMPKYHIFRHASENRIAAYLTIEPGQGMVGTPRFDKAFVDDFFKSCKEPIVIEEGDDEYTRNLKKQMREAKIEMMDRIRAGEKLEDIMSDTHREIQRLAAVKQEVNTMLREEVRSAKSEAEADDMIAAANKMLESKGIAPIKVTPLIKRALLRAVQKDSNTKK